MRLSDFLLDIDNCIYRLNSIITNDNKLRSILLGIQKGQNIFKCIQENVKDPGFLNHPSLESVKELGKYLIQQEKIQQTILIHITYPIILSILFIILSIILQSITNMNMMITPLLIISGVSYIIHNTQKNIQKAITNYWVICLLKGTIDVKSFQYLNPQIKVTKMRSIEDLVFSVTGSSNTNINILENQYKEDIDNVLKKCEYYTQLLSKLAIISIGFNLLYAMIKFYHTINFMKFI